MINRAAVIVRPAKPYVEWAQTLDDSGLEPDPSDDATVYLIPNYADEVEAWELLSKIYEEIFENELWSWHTEEDDWPKDRTFAMFRAWFEVEFHSIVEDLCAYELVDEDD